MEHFFAGTFLCCPLNYDDKMEFVIFVFYRIKTQDNDFFLLAYRTQLLKKSLNLEYLNEME